MENKSHAFIAGMFVLLLGIAALGAVFWLGGIRDNTNDYIVVTKQNIGGLNPQAQVRYRGIRVGKVSDIRIDPEDYTNILITISISDDIPLTTGTVAKLNYQGVTGLAHILLFETGKEATPLTPNDAQPPRIAMLPSMLEELSETGIATLRQARQLMISANDMLGEENRRHLNQMLGNMARTSGQLEPVLAQLQGTLGQVRKLLDDGNIDRISRSTAEIAPLLTETRQLLVKMQGVTDKLDATLGEPGGSGAAALMPRLNDLASEASVTSRQLGRLLRMLEESPQGLVFGMPALPPGPGEPGFSAQEGK